MPFLLSFCLLHVGSVLIINGLWQLKKLDTSAVIFINNFVGGIVFLTGLFLVFQFSDQAQVVKAGALTFLFSGTYFWIGFNAKKGKDSRGLGWYCLLVSITVFLHAGTLANGNETLGEIWLFLCWISWGCLWLIHFIHLILGKISEKKIGIFTLLVGVIFAWLPGYISISHSSFWSTAYN